MKIVIVGGTGLIGSRVVAGLRAKGHDVVAAAPSLGVDTITGDGLAAAVANAQIVVDLTNPKSFEDAAILAFFEKSGSNLIAAEAAAGVTHHVVLSVVGTDRLQASGYLRGKLAQEQLVRHSGIPYTILRATQFFEFMASIADLATVGQMVRLSPACVQPVSADDVAEAVTDIALGAPAGGIIEIAGPERGRLNEIVARFLRANNDPRDVAADPAARYFGAELNDQSLVPGGNPRIGPTSIEDWLRVRAIPPAAKQAVLF